jgi:hypothetical protein
MTNQEIKLLFYEVIQEKALYNKLEGISRNTFFNWVNERTIPSIGDMLGVLYQLNKIKISI